MWWEYALVAGVVVLAAGFVARTVLRSVGGSRGSCGCPGGCPAVKLPPRITRPRS